MSNDTSQLQVTRKDADQDIFSVVSGHNTYTVTYCGSGDADPEYVALWECTCSASNSIRTGTWISVREEVTTNA